MKTKLVYVLTCALEATYIEQALISIWSARYHNPDAHIVLLVDDKTNELLVGKRAEVLEYVTEKVVVEFDDANTSMLYRSRWLKSQVRELVVGDFLFIDCDTICQTSLCEIDDYPALIAMVPDDHMRLSDYPLDLINDLKLNTDKLEYNILKEEWYFNSGVIYAKDIPEVHCFWNLWNEEWKKGESLGVKADQPSLGKANLLCNHMITKLPNEWNTLIYMNPIFAKEGKILHFWNFRNKSFIFCKQYLGYIKENGLTEYAKKCILKPLKSILPFDNMLTKSNFVEYIKYFVQIIQQRKLYAKHVDADLIDFPWPKDYSLFRKYVSIKLKNKRKNIDVFYT